MKKMLSKLIVAVISYSLIFLPLVNTSMAEELTPPSGDLIAPKIVAPPVTKKFNLGERPTIHATVTDNVGVKNVSLFYRAVGEKDFQREDMQRTPGTDDYSATLPAITAPGTEYYLKATDFAGNNLLHGNSFAPLTLNVIGVPAVATQQGQEVTGKESAVSKPKPGINKWVWIGLGALAVGALASGGGGSTTTQTSTGSISITGKTPK